jgi:hypothetical protein
VRILDVKPLAHWDCIAPAVADSRPQVSAEVVGQIGNGYGTVGSEPRMKRLAEGEHLLRSQLRLRLQVRK